MAQLLLGGAGRIIFTNQTPDNLLRPEGALQNLADCGIMKRIFEQKRLIAAIGSKHDAPELRNRAKSRAIRRSVHRDRREFFIALCQGNRNPPILIAGSLRIP